MPVLAALLGAAALAATGLAAARGGGQRVGENIRVNPAGPIDASNSPSLVRNPGDPNNLVLAHRVDKPRFSAAVEWSGDGGRSWQQSPLPLPTGSDRPYAPDVAFAPDGRLYAAYVNLQGVGNQPANVWLALSQDGGRSFSSPVRVSGPLAFGVRVAVDRRGQIHLTWVQAAAVGSRSFTGSPNPVVAVRSADGGRTFGPAVTVSDRDRPRVGGASPVIDAGGRLLVLYQDFRDDRRDFENLEGPPWEGTFALVLTSSDDGGRTFRPGIVVEPAVVPSRRFLVFAPVFPSLAAGADGPLYVSWADARNGDLDVFVRKSADGGSTWSTPVRVNDSPLGDGTSQYLPSVAVAPTGRVDVVFLDRRADPSDVRTEATAAFSFDMGGSFDNIRLSSASFDSRIGPVVDQALGVDFGSRLAVLAGEHQTIAAWTDSRLGSSTTFRQDIVAAAVAPRPSPSSSLRLGLALSGVALLIAWFLLRRGAAPLAGPPAT